MKKLHYEIVIDAPREKVWDTVIGEETYKVWTSPFNQSSRFEGGWNKSDKIRFIGDNEDGTISGVISEIAESRKPDFISIHHLGFIHSGVEVIEGPEAEKWNGYENYTFTQTETGGTKFEAALDAEEEYEEMFNEMWPKALGKLKEISEK